MTRFPDDFEARMALLQEAHSLQKTPLYDRHVALGGKMVDFAGWLMPVYYTGIIAEHLWTRKSCGVFDVSHLGEIQVKGPGALDFLQYRLTNDLNKINDGQILYNLLCDEGGFALDDVLAYRSGAEDFYLIVNAANIGRDYEALSRYAPASVSLVDRSDSTACVAIQGPRSEGILERLFGFRLEGLRYYHFGKETLAGRPVWISRSGYTGEDGFEIFSEPAAVGQIWDKLIGEGRSLGTLPAGLGARNTLRLEAGNALYGSDMDRATTPLEAGLGWAVSFDKGRFVGRDGLLKQKEHGPRRRLVGFKMLDKPIAREGYPIFKAGRKIGVVTSGSYGPSAGYNIGLGFVEAQSAVRGTGIEIEVHGRSVRAEIAKLPFVPSQHKK
ncbi:MAG: glycine cleavage system aminomethyltransferase GcvT [Candidatus Omnitrophica bacterium]|nr:glycine cleavage system aminomethyltransferase GcvT [Candidatus Omnitrophota bacterium]